MPNSQTKKIAVVVVHGVSDQQPHDSARSIANILLQAKPEEKPQYSVWEEQSLRIPVLPMPKSTLPTNESDSSTKWFSWLDERGNRIRSLLDSKQDENNTEDNNKTLDDRVRDFNSNYLDDYSPKNLKSSYYDTICLKASRDDNREVHIYEMYWADLSRVGQSFFQVFSEFYQILFHLSALGRNTLDIAALAHPKGKLWWVYSRVHGWAGRILSIPIPLLSLFMLVAAFLHLPGNIPVSYIPQTIVSVAALLILFSIILIIARWNKIINISLPLLILAIVIEAVISGTHYYFPENFSYKALAINWMILLAIPLTILIQKYSLRRQGACEVAIGLSILLISTVIYNLFIVQDSHLGITLASFRTIELIYCLLVLSWFTFFIFYLLATLLGIVLRSKSSNESLEEKRIYRAIWTANISLWIPCVAFLVVTETFWSIVAYIGLPSLPKIADGQYIYHPSKWFLDWLFWDDIDYQANVFFDKLIVDLVFGIALITILIVLIIAVFSLMMSIVAEINPPLSLSQSSYDKKKSSIALGECLNKGYRAIYHSIYLISVVFIVAVACYFFLKIAFPRLEPFHSCIVTFNGRLIGITKITTGSITVIASGILVFGKRINLFSLDIIRKVIDIVLDVDNYFRLHPTDDNPRARIFTRYYSLLYYLASKENKYDASIVVAHSQGTVITADILRFIQQENLQEVKLPKVYFFSMGSPLRQLYSVAFPHLYNWVANEDSDSQFQGQSPKPQALGLEKWVNTYCSGDYVGRYLWKSSDTKTQVLFDPDPDNIPKEEKHHEFCLGAGAHTHYWDGIYDRVADEIDSLIKIL
jgi:hypothetical protein